MQYGILECEEIRFIGQVCEHKQVIKCIFMISIYFQINIHNSKTALYTSMKYV